MIATVAYEYRRDAMRARLMVLVILAAQGSAEAICDSGWAPNAGSLADVYLPAGIASNHTIFVDIQSLPNAPPDSSCIDRHWAFTNKSGVSLAWMNASDPTIEGFLSPSGSPTTTGSVPGPWLHYPYRLTIAVSAAGASGSATIEIRRNRNSEPPQGVASPTPVVATINLHFIEQKWNFLQAAGGKALFSEYWTCGAQWCLNTDLETVLGEIGWIYDVDLTAERTRTWAMVLAAGQIKLSSKTPTTNWTAWLDAEAQTGTSAWFLRGSAAHLNGDLHLCAVSDYGEIWRFVRNAWGGWSWNILPGVSGTYWVDVSCSADRGMLDILGVTNVGYFYHNACDANGTAPCGGWWNVDQYAGHPGTIVDISSHFSNELVSDWTGTYVRSRLYVVGVTQDGRVWATNRWASGWWSPFVDIELSGAGEGGSFARTGIGILSGYLQVPVVTNMGTAKATNITTDFSAFWPWASWLPSASSATQAVSIGSTPF